MIFRLCFLSLLLSFSNASINPCEFCNFLLPIAKELIALNDSSSIETFAVAICQHFHLADDTVCSGYIDEYIPVVVEVLRRSPLQTHEICGVAFNCMKQSDIPSLQWNVTIPPPSKNRSTNIGSANYSILHLADLHIDMDYKPGSNANCGRPLCCRDGEPRANETGAGFWGDYRTCDIPPWTAENMLNHIRQTEENLDWIYFTGDIAPHDVWQQTQIKDLEEISHTTRLLNQTFPTKKIYPCVGNHESAPPDLFPTNNMSWLYPNLANQWISQFGLPEETRETIILGGYYTTLVHSKLRLISLNMNYCSENNYWLFINSTDPLGQVQWLIQWLQYAEEHDEYVHIIGHHPPRQCMVSFSWSYAKIITRYEQIITGQFFAHTHFDEFMIFYDEKDMQRPVSIAYITPSFTTYPSLNPGYRFYTIEMNSSVILDHRTVILNLTATNLLNTTQYLTEYSAKAAFNMTDLSPQSWNELVTELETNLDSPLMNLVYQFYTKSSSFNDQCNQTCRLDLINCQLKTARAQDTTFCSHI